MMFLMDYIYMHIYIYMSVDSQLDEGTWILIQIWAQLFKEQINLSTGQIAIQWIVYSVLLPFIHWLAIYPVDSVIHPLNNRALFRRPTRSWSTHQLISIYTEVSLRFTSAICWHDKCCVT